VISSKIPCLMLAISVSICLAGAPEYRCLRVQTPVVIDGSLLEWKDVKPIVLKAKDQVVNSEWRGPEDLSGQVYLQWDHENLYMAANVCDDRLHFAQDTYTMWMCDSLQFTLDVNGTKGGWGGDDYSYTLGFVREMQKFMDLKVTGSDVLRPVLYRLDHATQRPPGEVTTVRAAGKTNEKGYVLEIAIPWAELNPLVPIQGTPCAFDVIVNDNDGNGRKGWIAWTPGIGEDAGTGPFGDLVFAGRSDLELFGSTLGLLYKDNENVGVRLFVNSPGEARDVSRECRLLSPGSQQLASFDKKVDLKSGLNVFENSWSTGEHPRGQYRVVGVLKSSNSVCRVSFQKESLTYLRKRSEVLREKVKSLEAMVAEAKKKGINTQYPQVSVGTIRETCDNWEFMASDQGRKRPDIAERMVSFVEGLEKRTREELEGLLANPSAAKPKVPELDLAKGFSIRDGVIYNGENPIILIGMMAGGRLENMLKVIEKSPEMGFNFFNIHEPVGPSRILDAEGNINKGNLEMIRKQLEKARERNLAVDLHLSDHYYEGALSKEFPDVYDGKGCKVGCHGIYGSKCLDSAHTREILRRWLSVLLPTVRDNPSLFSYDLGNESRFTCSCAERMKLFRAWLMQMYGGVEKVNAVWGTNLRSLEEIPAAYRVNFETNEYGTAVFTPFYQEHPAARYDYTRFGQVRFRDWFDYFHKTVRSLDDKTPTFIKLMMIAVPYKEHQLAGCGVDREGLAEVLEINGMDGAPLYIYYPNVLGKRMDKAYMGALFCDLLKCMTPGKPVMNAENLCADYNFSYLSPEAYRMAIWDEVLHGQAMTDVWLWSDNMTWSPNSQYDSRPEMMDGLGRASLDIRRLAPEIVKFHQMPRDVKILYSQTSLTWSDETEQSLFDWYVGLAGLDEGLGFITEKQILGDGLNDARVLVIPKVNFLPENVVEKIREFARKGGTVLVSSPSLEFDEYGRKRTAGIPGAKVYAAGFNPADIRHAESFDRLLTEAKVFRPVRVVGKDGVGNPNVESRTVVLGPKKYLTFVLNRSEEAMSVNLKIEGGSRSPAEIRDLISLTTAESFPLPSAGVLLLETTMR